MSKFIIVILLLFSSINISCSVETPEQLEHKLKKLKIQQQEEIEGKNKIEEVEKIRKELELNCIIVDNNYYYFRRCENNEVICYIHYDGISCNLKGGNK